MAGRKPKDLLGGVGSVPGSSNPIIGDSGSAVTGIPDFSNILNSSARAAVKRDKILKELGKKSPRKKYASPEERKAASRERAKKRREERNAELAKYGLAPKPRGPKLSDEEKKAKRSERAKLRRSLYKEMLKDRPDIVEEFKIDLSRFRFKKK